MTNAEHLIENAISYMKSGKSYEDFAQGINREMAGNIDWYLEEIWQMADYVVNKMCLECNKRVHWISVDDELPEPDTDDLLFIDTFGDVNFGKFGYSKFYSDGFGYTLNEVTHWIPIACLPSPEKKGESE